MSARLSLRRRLRCKDFSWYLSTVWPEHFLPTRGRRTGYLRLLDTDLCVRTPRRNGNTGSGQPSGPAALEECAATPLLGGGGIFVPQLLVLTERDPNNATLGRFLMADEGLCLDAPGVAALEEGEGAEEAEALAPEATVRFQVCLL